MHRPQHFIYCDGLVGCMRERDITGAVQHSWNLRMVGKESQVRAIGYGAHCSGGAKRSLMRGLQCLQQRMIDGCRPGLKLALKPLNLWRMGA